MIFIPGIYFLPLKIRNFEIFDVSDFRIAKAVGALLFSTLFIKASRRI